MPCAVRCSRRVLVVLALLCAAAGASADGGGARGSPTTPRRGTKAAAKRRPRAERGRGQARRPRRGGAQGPVGARDRRDGVFGAQTEQAVKRFQKRKGLTADGVVGPDTRDALGLEPFARGSRASASRAACKLPRMLRLIAECESGGNPRAVSPGGQYRGKYQFSLDTWHNLGGDGDPVDASEAEQDRIALKLYRRSGTVALAELPLAAPPASARARRVPARSRRRA